MRARALIVIFGAALGVACGAIRSYEIVQQPIATTLSAGLGGKLFRIERSSDLPNAYRAGKRRQRHRSPADT
jgi:hypothetical protein